MMRETNAANAKHAFMIVTPVRTAWERRLTTGGSSSNTNGPAVTAPYWVRVTRSGNTFRGEVSSNGTTWTQVGSVTISMGSTINVGLALTSHNNAVLNTSTFTNVTKAP
jgi:regulation of enolase protein 1 (concanavalin A-like superfamily)